MESRRSLWRHPDFMRLWGGQTISRFGSEVSRLALPTVAILLLHATPAQVGFLAALEFLPFPVLGLLVGVWVDRLHRRPILIACDVGRALVLATIPVAAAMGRLALPQMYVVALTTGVFTVFFDVAYQSYLPVLVPRAQLVEGNSKLEVSNSTAQVAGPAMAGFLIQVVGGARAVGVDALSFVASVLSLLLVHRPEPPVAVAAAPGLRGFMTDLREGLTVVLGNPILRRIAACTATWNLGSNAYFAVQLIFAYRVMHFSAGLLGGLFGVASLGALVGAVVAQRVTNAVGVGPTLIGSSLLGALALFVVPLAPVAIAIPLWASSMFIGSFAGPVYNITQVSLRQAITPDRVQGRMQATMRTIVWGTIPVGAAAGGLLGGVIGLRSTLLLGAAVTCLATLWLLTVRIAGLRDQPEPVAG